MPIYEYRCQACGHELEKLQKLSDDPLTECPACHESALVKKISAAGFRLKGGGWYETDFKKDGKRNLAGDSAGKETSSSAPAGEGGSSGGGSDSSKSSSTSSDKTAAAGTKSSSTSAGSRSGAS
jgi:putative FmdB family regulatory protein